MSYTIKSKAHGKDEHFIQVTDQEPNYGIVVRRCIYTPDDDKILYERAFVSDCEDDTFSLSEEEDS